MFSKLVFFFRVSKTFGSLLNSWSSMMPQGGQDLSKMLKTNDSLHPQSGLGMLIRYEKWKITTRMCIIKDSGNIKISQLQLWALTLNFLYKTSS